MKVIVAVLLVEASHVANPCLSSSVQKWLWRDSASSMSIWISARYDFLYVCQRLYGLIVRHAYSGEILCCNFRLRSRMV